MMPASWLQNLNRTIESAKADANSRNTSYFFTLPRLIELSKAPSKDKILNEIEKKINNGELGVFYRIISPETKAIVAEFDSVSDIPEFIYDDTAGHEITVDPLSNIEVVFRVSPR